MTGIGLFFTFAAAGLLFSVPRRWCLLPLLVGVVYVPFSQEIEVGVLHFTALRILTTVGFLRVLAKGERIAGGLVSLDKLMILWGIWLVCSSIFHEETVLITRLGVVFDDLGVYFLFRIFLQESEDIHNIFKIACVIFVPLALLMLLEKTSGKNYFGLLFGGWTESLVRNGRFRAQGPFEHPILAGTVGAVFFPMALNLWRQECKLALVGLLATGGVIVASASSGPIMTLFSILGAMAVWNFRGYLRTICWLAVVLVIVLNFVMQDPVYFLIARIDLAGGSTGWYRAQLIKSAIDHFDEWWLAGTDFTRHWMHVKVSEGHTDITNHFIQMGVWGGMPLMLLFMAVLYAGFSAVSRSLRINREASRADQFKIWTFGCILFGHATTFFSVSYFDQSIVFLYLLLASIGSLDAAKLVLTPIAVADVPLTTAEP